MIPQPIDESGWVIERGDSDPAEPKYWCAYHGNASRMVAWTSNHEWAIRFARQKDAERVAKLVMPHMDVRICEHIWSASGPQL